jgi:hypothetical protein
MDNKMPANGTPQITDNCEPSKSAAQAPPDMTINAGKASQVVHRDPNSVMVRVSN